MTFFRYLISCGFLLSSMLLTAQDTLKLKDNSIPLVKIIEVNEVSIKYKKSDFPKGPSYHIALEEVSSVIYANGLKETFSRTSASTKTPSDSNAYVSYNAPMPAYKIREAKRLAKIKKPWKKSGPRIGFTYLGEGQVSDWINNQGKNPFVTQIGWEMESRIFTSENGIAAMAEYNFLFAGLEQGLFMPNGSILLAIRGPEGIEFALGPNLFYYDAYYLLGMEFSVGTTFQWSDVYFPVNLSFVPTVKRDETVVAYNGTKTQVQVQTGFRINLTIGFYHKKR